MADSVTDGGIYFPSIMGGLSLSTPATFTNHTITVSNAVAFVGRVFLAGKPGSKIMSSAGGAISFRTGGTSVWTALSTLGIGITDVSTAGPPARSDLTFDVSRTITSSTVTLTTNTWHRFTMAFGTKTLSHGQTYAFLVRMGTRVSTDAASVAALSSNTGTGPVVVTLSAGTAWTAATGSRPNVLFETDDGTLGWFAGGTAVSSISALSISSGGANSEYGVRFVPPWTCHVDELVVRVNLPNSAADYTVVLYSNPNTTPVTITSIAALAEEHPAATSAYALVHYPLQAPHTLSASTTYLLGVIPASTNPVTIQLMEFSAAGHKVTWNGGTGLATGARVGGAGAFSIVETNIPLGFAVRLSQIVPAAGGATVTVTTTTTITLTVGGGAGGIKYHPGMGGGLRG